MSLARRLECWDYSLQNHLASNVGSFLYMDKVKYSSSCLSDSFLIIYLVRDLNMQIRSVDTDMWTWRPNFEENVLSIWSLLLSSQLLWWYFGHTAFRNCQHTNCKTACTRWYVAYTPEAVDFITTSTGKHFSKTQWAGGMGNRTPDLSDANGALYPWAMPPQVNDWFDW